MIPAIGISLLLGTGSNAFFMALAVPLGQTALSLVIDKVWGTTSSKPKPRTRTRRTKKKPFVRPARREKKIRLQRKKGAMNLGRQQILVRLKTVAREYISLVDGMS